MGVNIRVLVQLGGDMIQKQIMKVCREFFENEKDTQIGKLTILKKENEYWFYHYHMLVLVWDVESKEVKLQDSECRTDKIIGNNFKQYLEVYIANV